MCVLYEPGPLGKVSDPTNGLAKLGFWTFWILPTTSRVCWGVLVPIPVLPLPKTVSLSVPLELRVSILFVAAVPVMFTSNPLAVVAVLVLAIAWV